jgi:hypothetical protein
LLVLLVVDVVVGGSSMLVVTGRCSTVSTALRNEASARLLHAAEYHTCL